MVDLLVHPKRVSIDWKERKMVSEWQEQVLAGVVRKRGEVGVCIHV
jgi:hypothetical protein